MLWKRENCVYLRFVGFLWFYDCSKNIMNGSYCLVGLYIIVGLIELVVFSECILFGNWKKNDKDFKKKLLLLY